MGNFTASFKRCTIVGLWVAHFGNVDNDGGAVLAATVNIANFGFGGGGDNICWSLNEDSNDVINPIRVINPT